VSKLPAVRDGKPAPHRTFPHYSASTPIPACTENWMINDGNTLAIELTSTDPEHWEGD
jgi:hypothetical protein